MSKHVLQNVLNMSGKCPENVRTMSGKSPEHVRKMSRKCSENVRKVTRFSPKVYSQTMFDFKKSTPDTKLPPEGAGNLSKSFNGNHFHTIFNFCFRIRNLVYFGAQP